MKAKVTTEFPGRPDGESQARAIKVDEVISGELAEVAVREKWAEEVGDEPSEKVDLSDMTVAELEAFAAEKGIDLDGATKKADIRAAIELALE